MLVSVGLNGPIPSWLSGLTSKVSSPTPPIITASAILDTTTHGSLWSRTAVSRFLSATASLYSPAEKRMIQQVVVATSSFTVIAVLITFWYFYQMQRKRLRHKLVMLSILGCFIRGLWYLIFSITVIGGKAVESSSVFCQATGFFILVGNEMSDIAILFIAIHGALQIFRPSVTDQMTGDGLDDYRKYCFATILLLPVILASIAFVNPNNAYTAQGAFCSLPTSPIWYRLALSYGPRYFVGLSVIVLSLAVYIHVEFKFRSFAKSQRGWRTSIAFPSSQSPVPEMTTVSNTYIQNHLVTPRDDFPPQRRGSLPSLTTPNYPEPVSILQRPEMARLNLATAQEDSIQTHCPLTVFPGRKLSYVSTGSRDTAKTSSKSYSSQPDMSMLRRANSALHRSTTSSLVPSPELTALERQVIERKALKRQLRLIFVYPIVYVMLWIPPCTLNAMQYSSRYAHNLPVWLAVLSTVCLTLMGGVDCIVFFWREKPWRHSRHRTSSTSMLLRKERGSDASRDSEKDGGSIPRDSDVKMAEHAQIKSGLVRTVTTLSPKRTSEASNSSTVAKQRAYERLALEIRDRKDGARWSSHGKVSTDTHDPEMWSAGAESPRGSHTKREWWDRQDSMS